jgi:hypothetical protein
LRFFWLQLRLLFKCPAIRVSLLFSLRYPSPLKCLILDGLSVTVECVGHIHCWDFESCLGLICLLLRLGKWLLNFLIVLMLLASCLRRILVTERLWETVWDWWWEVVGRCGWLCIAVYIRVHLLLLLARVILFNRQRSFGESGVIAIGKYLRRWRVLWWRQKILDLFHAVFQVLCRAVEVLLAFLLAFKIVIGLQE